MKLFLKTIVLAATMSLFAACGSSFEWFPDTDTTVNTDTPVNAAPVANAGANKSVLIGDIVVLDGSGSSDANGDTLTYNWELTPPSGSAASLSSITAVDPTFTPDVVGDYNLSLTVNDGKADSSPATVTITAFDTPPVANAGADKDAFTGTTITLDGSASIGANLSYNWRFADKPIGSGDVSLSSATVVRPTFTTNIPGTYVIELIVKDRLNSSLPNTVTVAVSNLGFITVTW